MAQSDRDRGSPSQNLPSAFPIGNGDGGGGRKTRRGSKYTARPCHQSSWYVRKHGTVATGEILKRLRLYSVYSHVSLFVSLDAVRVLTSATWSVLLRKMSRPHVSNFMAHMPNALPTDARHGTVSVYRTLASERASCRGHKEATRARPSKTRPLSVCICATGAEEGEEKNADRRFYSFETPSTPIVRQYAWRRWIVGPADGMP